VNRRGRVLEALGLTPLWVRRAPLAERSAVDVREDEPVERVVPTQLVEAAPASKAGSMDWAQLRAAVASCTACPLHKGRRQAVFGVGDEHAEWLFVGEGPGAEEDARGEPFVGQAGKLLDNMLGAAHLRRGDNVYIANIVKCRPPGNRTPEPAETHACEPYLRRQIELLRPRLIVALGKVAANNLLGTEATIGSLRGRVFDFRGIALIVTYHPAYLLRNLADKAKAWEDLCFAVETMRALKTRAAAPT
jgi:DNA polymerase